MSRLLAAGAVLFAVASCGTPHNEAATPATRAGGNTQVFCEIWPDARGDLLASWNNESESDESGWAIRLEAEIARYDRIVPPAMRPDWDEAHAVFTDIADLRFTVGYYDSRIRPEHLAMVFGEAGPEAAIAAAETAIDRIDVWAARSCGDFCSRWEDIERAVQFEPGLHPDAMRDVLLNADRHQLWMNIGTQIVPDAVAGAWETAVSIRSAYLEYVRDRDVADYTSEEAEFERFTNLVGRPLDRLAEHSHQALEAIHEWRSRNCGQSALTTTGSGPGRLTVELGNDPSVVGGWVLLALLPDGGDFGSVGSITDYVAGTCDRIQPFEEFAVPVDWSFEEVAERIEAGQRPEVIAADLGYDLRDFLQQWSLERFGVDVVTLADRLEEGIPFNEVADAMGFDPMEALTPSEHPATQVLTLQPINDDTEYSDDACQFVEEQQAILEPGDYELYVGAYDGDPGDWRFFVAAPMACSTIPVTIGGDTTVEVPPLGPCSIGAVGSDREIERRSPPPGDRDSSLRVRLPTPHGDDSPFGCVLHMAILPTGTTLNDVGRGDVWPSGGVAVGRPALEHVDPSMGDEAVLVPILAYPTTSGLFDLWIDLRHDGSWMGSSLDPAPLIAGEYDLHVEQACFVQPDDDEDAVRTCGMGTVDVQGATVMDLPDLGDCP